MALLFMDGFSDNSAGKWSITTGSYSVGNASPRVTNGYYGYITATINTDVVIYKSIQASSQVFVGFGAKIPNPTNQSYDTSLSFYGDNSATAHITVRHNDISGLLEIRRGNTTGTIVATGTTSLAPGSWYYIEVSATISDTVGQVHVRLNGSPTDEVSFTGDTKNAGTNTTIDAIRMEFYKITGGESGAITDVYVLDSTGSTNNTFLGDVTVKALSPSGNGTYSQLTGSDGNSTDNYALVDELPFVSTDYVGSGTSGQRDTYALSNLPAGIGGVYGLQVTSLTSKSDIGTVGAKHALRTGGSLYYGASFWPSTSPGIAKIDVFETNPNTGTQWTVSDVNNLEAGMEIL